MKDYPSNRALETYWYDEQISNYIVQFMAVFSGVQVAIGENDDVKQSNLIEIPIRYGSADRVVNAILADNTTNVPVKVPTFSAYLKDIQMAPELRKGVNTVERRTVFEQGGSFPNDIKVIERLMPIPYMGVFDLNIMVSNTNQHLQVLEQILTLFDPALQIQVSDSDLDWKRLSMIELTNVSLDENFPSAQDARIIQSVLTFNVPFYLSPPAVINKNYVAKIKMRLNNISDAGNVSPTGGVPYFDLASLDAFTFPDPTN